MEVEMRIFRMDNDWYLFVTDATTLHFRRSHWHPLGVREGWRAYKHRLGGHLCTIGKTRKEPTMIDPFPMITAANTLEASPKPSYGPHKASERYLDREDQRQINDSLGRFNLEDVIDGFAVRIDVSEFLQALETLRTHLRKKYYAG